jgi:membrane protein required for colicin V production
MATFDIVVLVVIGAMIVVSMSRGLVAEIASMVIWLVSFIGAKMFAIPLSDIIFASIEPKSLSIALTFGVLFIVLFFAQRLAKNTLTAGLKAIGLGGVNRLLGACFGFVKGVLIVTIVVLVCAFTDLPKQPEWQEAWLSPVFEQLALLIVPYLPPSLGGYVQYPIVSLLQN